MPEAPPPLAPPLAPLRTAAFDYDLPERLIAQAPARPRDAARLLVVRPGALEDRGIADLPGLLAPGDLLVVNDTRVIAARLRAHRGEAAIEIMLNRAEGGGLWHALVRNARRLRPGDRVTLDQAPGISGRVVERQEGGAVLFDFGAADLRGVGEIPLPPYIHRAAPDAADAEDYQTIFADKPGAVAAPTASLHFTAALLEQLRARNVGLATVTLHVGAGTFLPVREEDPRAHRMHAEWCSISAATAARIEATRAAGGRVVAVGSTALRSLETAAARDGRVAPFEGLTDIFILPGHRFRAVDALLTNFHLPRSTLLMLVSAFSGSARMRAAYAHAVAAEYRFFSYGDASLLFRAEDS